MLQAVIHQLLQYRIAFKIWTYSNCVKVAVVHHLAVFSFPFLVLFKHCNQLPHQEWGHFYQIVVLI